METREFGKSGVRVTALGYGGMELRVPENHASAQRLLNTALDCGICLIDTSQDYGESESLIGRHIAHRRDEYFLATKCACNLSGCGPSHIFTRAQLSDNLADSLRKLRTDRIDLWQLHCATPPDLPGGPLDDAVRAMQEAKEKGYARLIGISFKNGSKSDADYPVGHQTRYALEMAGWGVFDGIQLVYGALTPASAADIAVIGNLGVGVIARGALQRYFDYYNDIPARANLAELLGEGESLASFLLRYALAAKGVSSLIVGSASEAHIRQNALAAGKGPLDARTFAEAGRRIVKALTELAPQRPDAG